MHEIKIKYTNIFAKRGERVFGFLWEAQLKYLYFRNIGEEISKQNYSGNGIYPITNWYII